MRFKRACGYLETAHWLRVERSVSVVLVRGVAPPTTMDMLLMMVVVTDFLTPDPDDGCGGHRHTAHTGERVTQSRSHPRARQPATTPTTCT